MTEITLRIVQTSVEWNIRNISIEGIDEGGKFINSPTFSFAKDKWFLRIYTSGKNTDCPVPLCLYKVQNLRSLPRVSFTLGVSTWDGSVISSVSDDKLFHDFMELGEERGGCFQTCELLQATDLVSIFGGKLTVFCSMHMYEDPASKPPPSKSFEILSQNYKDLFLNSTHGDINIVVQGREFHAHKLVLTVRSPVFASMFKHEMIENKTGVVSIEDCDPDTFGDFLYFVYSGEFDRVSPTNAMSLFKTAAKYDLKDLKEACSQYLAKNLLVDSICDVIHLAVLYDDSELLKTATNYFVIKAYSILSTSKWEEFLKEHSSIANKLFIETLHRYDKWNPCTFVRKGEC